MTINLNYFISAYLPNKKAHSVQVLKMCDELSLKYKVNLICGYSYNKKIRYDYDLKNSFKISSIKIFNLRILNMFYKILNLKKFKKKNDDILYTRDVHYAFFGLLFYKKIYLELHLSYLKRINISYFFLKKIFKQKNIKVIFISKELLNIYKNKIGVPKYFIVAHDCSDNKYLKNPTKKKNKKLSVGYCGHLYTGRGIEIIFKLAKIEKNIDFNILGGFKVDKDELLKFNKIPKNVNFFEHTKHRHISNFLGKNDILIAPYQTKLGKFGEIDTAKYMSPLKIFEYMSAKKAIICSDHKVLKEVLRNNFNALLCNPNNLKEWCSALKRLKKKKLRNFLAHNAYKDFKNFYTWNKRINKIFS